jgi:serine phosphatase RsbU (regulator of sigma subunit)
VKPGFLSTLDDFPDFEGMLASHGPSFVRDLRETRLKGAGLQVQHQLSIVSTVRIPIIGPAGAIGLLTLGWTHGMARPSEELLAIMQRFADQAAIAWQNALRAEAQRQADALHETLHRVVALAPSFHIAGTREEVAQASCEAALATFDCKLASLYRVEGDRLRVLGCAPPLECVSLGRTFPLREDMPLVSEMRSHTPTFIPDVNDSSRLLRPWPAEVVAQAGTSSALYVPLRFDERGPQNLLVLNWDKPRERPDENFLVIVERFADQVALALTNASAEQLHARLEASLLPTTPIDHPLLHVITRYRTGEQRLRLGGDFVGSTVAADQGLDFIIGDVSGHGPDAAALGATLRSTWKALMLAGEGIPETVDVMRRVLLADRTDPTAFATIVAGHIDVSGHSLSLVNAGHLPPLLVAGTVDSLSSNPTPPLGVDKEGLRALIRFPLPERWSLFCYTDGLVDARVAPDSSERYGEDRLKHVLGGWAGEIPDEARVDALMNEIETSGGGHFADDVAVLLVATKD